MMSIYKHDISKIYVKNKGLKKKTNTTKRKFVHDTNTFTLFFKIQNIP